MKLVDFIYYGLNLETLESLKFPSSLTLNMIYQINNRLINVFCFFCFQGATSVDYDVMSMQLKYYYTRITIRLSIVHCLCVRLVLSVQREIKTVVNEHLS